MSLRNSYRKTLISVLYWFKNEWERRFDQPAIDDLVQLESLVLNHSKEFSASEIQIKLGVHTTDFDVDLLTLQMKIATKPILNALWRHGTYLRLPMKQIHQVILYVHREETFGLDLWNSERIFFECPRVEMFWNCHTLRIFQFRLCHCFCSCHVQFVTLQLIQYALSNKINHLKTLLH